MKKNVMVGSTDQNVVKHVEPVSTTHCVTTSTGAAYRGVVRDIKDKNVTKNVPLVHMASTVEKPVAYTVTFLQTVTEQQESV